MSVFAWSFFSFSWHSNVAFQVENINNSSACTDKQGFILDNHVIMPCLVELKQEEAPGRMVL
jgi:hypothetical protein